MYHWAVAVTTIRTIISKSNPSYNEAVKTFMRAWPWVILFFIKSKLRDFRCVNWSARSLGTTFTHRLLNVRQINLIPLIVYERRASCERKVVILYVCKVLFYHFLPWTMTYFEGHASSSSTFRSALNAWLRKQCTITKWLHDHESGQEVDRESNFPVQLKMNIHVDITMTTAHSVIEIENRLD